MIDGVPEETRTPDPLLRRQLLYPTELQAQMWWTRSGLNTQHPVCKTGALPIRATSPDNGETGGT